MDRILKILKKENGPWALSAPALELNTIIFKHVYWFMQQISGEHLQDHWSSGLIYQQLLIEPRWEKTSLWGLRPGLTQISLYCFRRRLEA